MNLVLQALAFPLKKSSLVMLGCLIALNMTASVITLAPMLIGGVLSLALGGFIYAVYFQIIYTTGNGYEEAPRFPEFNNVFDNMLVPLLKVLLITLISFLPTGIYVALAAEGTHEGIALTLILVGHLYLPMGMMVAALDNVSKALNPAIVLQGIRASGLTYFIMAGAIFGFYIIESSIENAFSGSWIASGIVTSFGIMFSARLIGSVYREKILPLEA